MENNLNRRLNERALAVTAAIVGHSLWGFSYMFTQIALTVASPDVLLTDAHRKIQTHLKRKVHMASDSVQPA